MLFVTVQMFVRVVLQGSMRLGRLGLVRVLRVSWHVRTVCLLLIVLLVSLATTYLLKTASYALTNA